MMLCDSSKEVVELNLLILSRGLLGVTNMFLCIVLSDCSSEWPQKGPLCIITLAYIDTGYQPVPRVAMHRGHHLPHSVGGITRAVLVTDEAVKARRTESLLTIRAFKACFTQTSSIDVVTLRTVLTLTPLVALWTIGAHRTVFLTSEGKLHRNDTKMLHRERIKNYQ